MLQVGRLRVLVSEINSSLKHPAVLQAAKQAGNLITETQNSEILLFNIFSWVLELGCADFNAVSVNH